MWLSRPALSGDGGSGLEDDFGLAADSGIDLEGGGTEDGLAVEVEGVDYELADATISSSDDDFLLTPDDDFENDFADESGTQVIALDEGDDSFPASPVDEFGDEDLDATTFAASPPRRSSSFGRASPAPRPPQKEATLRNVLLLALFALAALVVLFTAALLTKMNDSDEEPPAPPSVRQSTPGTTRSRLAMRSADGQSTCPPVGDVAVHSRSRARA